MSGTDSNPKPTVSEKTFSGYTQAQGKNYAAHRPDYHPDVYQWIMSQHTSSGGYLDTLIDVGCGPGNVAGNLAQHFTHAFGLDPSAGMLDTARSKGYTTAIREAVRFEVSSAEDLGRGLVDSPVADGSVDLITAGNAAHWFDMSHFWDSAARVLKPGGSVILWSTGEASVHPEVLNAAKIQNLIEDTRESQLRPFYEPGNLLVRTRYHDLVLPWTANPPVPGFDEKSFVREEWDPAQPFHAGPAEFSLPMFEKILGTGSPVTRWREAHLEAVGTEEDVVRKMRRGVERLLHEAGVKPGEERIKGTVYAVILFVKKMA